MPSFANTTHPPPAHTGAPGEQTCAACHKDKPSEAATITLTGLPARYAPGARYPLTLRFAYPPMKRAGFQLSAKFEAGGQAGDFSANDARVEVIGEAGIRYIQHSPEGVVLTAPPNAEWTFTWQAPEKRAGAVTFYLGVNGANYDASDFGDAIFVRSWRVN